MTNIIFQNLYTLFLILHIVYTLSDNAADLFDTAILNLYVLSAT